MRVGVSHRPPATIPHSGEVARSTTCTFSVSTRGMAEEPDDLTPAERQRA
ncbi:hypothetical protein [Krasilnikovia sp. MM14-A1004]